MSSVQSKSSVQSNLNTATCTVCSGDATFMASHPQANLYRCGRCSHAFSILDSSAGARYDDSYYDYEHKRWFENPNYWIFGEMEKALRADVRSVLDVGCGRGDFLRFLRAKRPAVELMGIDLSEQRTDSEYEFVRCDVEEFKTEKRFDAIVSLSVIEHVKDPRLFVSRLVDLLNPAGQLFLLTVRDDSILYDLARFFRSVGIPTAFDRLYSAHHLNHFTARSLRTLLENNGLVIDRTVMHNSLLRAVDIPARNRILDALLRVGVAMIHVAGTLTTRAYLQAVMTHRADERST